MVFRSKAQCAGNGCLPCQALQRRGGTPQARPKGWSVSAQGGVAPLAKGTAIRCETRLAFYYLCAPSQGFAQLRAGIASGSIKSPSAEINEIKMVPLAELAEYDLFSADDRFLRDDLPRLVQPSQPGGKIKTGVGDKSESF